MTTGASRCPDCNEKTQEGFPTLSCPLEGDPPCPLMPPLARWTVGEVLGGTVTCGGDETVSYGGGRTVTESDGFPVIDDLTDRALGQYWMSHVIGSGSMGRVYQA